MDLEGVREHSLRQVSDTISAHSMLSEGERVLVGFSGGADSTAAAIIMSSLGYDVVLAHVDHGMRLDSHADVIHCSQISAHLGLPFVSRAVTVLPPTEAMARDARYAALEEMSVEVDAPKIATGHTFDDDAETVLMRLDRGGIGIGIPPCRGNIVRPLIDLRRSETEAICRDAGVDFLSDPSNLDHAYERNRVRAELRAGGESKILELVATGRANALMVAQGRALAEDVMSASVKTEDMTLIPEEALRMSEAGIARQILRLASSRLGREVTGGAVNEALSKVLGRTGARTQLTEDLWAWAEPGYLVVGRMLDVANFPPVRLWIGHNVVPGWHLEVSLGVSPPSPVPSDAYTALLDRSIANGPFILRGWEPGDRFHPLGGPGTRKLHDFFIDQKVPRRIRGRIPVLLCGDVICWVIGYRIDERFKVTPATHEGLRVAVTALTIDQPQG